MKYILLFVLIALLAASQAMRVTQERLERDPFVVSLNN